MLLGYRDAFFSVNAMFNALCSCSAYKCFSVKLRRTLLSENVFHVWNRWKTEMGFVYKAIKEMFDVVGKVKQQI